MTAKQHHKFTVLQGKKLSVTVNMIAVNHQQNAAVNNIGF